MPEVGLQPDQRNGRTLGIRVPLRLAALFNHNVATYQMTRSEVIAASTGRVRDRLRGEILELLVVARAHTGQMPGGDQFAVSWSGGWHRESADG